MPTGTQEIKKELTLHGNGDKAVLVKKADALSPAFSFAHCLREEWSKVWKNNNEFIEEKITVIHDLAAEMDFDFREILATGDLESLKREGTDISGEENEKFIKKNAKNVLFKKCKNTQDENLRAFYLVQYAFEVCRKIRGKKNSAGSVEYALYQALQAAAAKCLLTPLTTNAQTDEKPNNSPSFLFAKQVHGLIERLYCATCEGYSALEKRERPLAYQVVEYMCGDDHAQGIKQLIHLSFNRFSDAVAQYKSLQIFLKMHIAAMDRDLLLTQKSDEVDHRVDIMLAISGHIQQIIAESYRAEPVETDGTKKTPEFIAAIIRVAQNAKPFEKEENKIGLYHSTPYAERIAIELALASIWENNPFAKDETKRAKNAAVESKQDERSNTDAQGEHKEEKPKLKIKDERLPFRFAAAFYECWKDQLAQYKGKTNLKNIAGENLKEMLMISAEKDEIITAVEQLNMLICTICAAERKFGKAGAFEKDILLPCLQYLQSRLRQVPEWKQHYNQFTDLIAVIKIALVDGYKIALEKKDTPYLNQLLTLLLNKLDYIPKNLKFWSEAKTERPIDQTYLILKNKILQIQGNKTAIALEAQLKILHEIADMMNNALVEMSKTRVAQKGTEKSIVKAAECARDAIKDGTIGLNPRNQNGDMLYPHDEGGLLQQAWQAFDDVVNARLHKEGIVLEAVKDEQEEYINVAFGPSF